MRAPGLRCHAGRLVALILADVTLQSWSLRHTGPKPHPAPDCQWAERLSRANSEAQACANIVRPRLGDFLSNEPFQSPRRIGLLIRGESYRKGSGQGDRNDSTITLDGVYWQNLSSRSHVEQVIRPMEACGYTVDVYIGTYDHRANKISRQPIEDLLRHYAPRVRGRLIVPGSKKRLQSSEGSVSGEWGASTMYEESFKLITKRHEDEHVAYDAILVTRHDVIFSRPLVHWPGVEWDKVVFPFNEKLLSDSVSDIFQWFPWKYMQCASGCGYSGHGLGACLTQLAGTSVVSFVLHGAHNSNTAAEANPVYRLARSAADETRNVILIAGDFDRLPSKDARKGQPPRPFVPVRVTGGSLVKHVLGPTNRHILDPHGRTDVIVHCLTGGMERQIQMAFADVGGVAKVECVTPSRELLKAFKSKLGGDLTDMKDVMWAYSIEKAVDMMKEVEQGKGIRYQRVFIARPDTVLLADLDLFDIVKDNTITVNRRSSSSPRYFHFAMPHVLALAFRSLYSKLPPGPPKKGRTWLSEFVEGHLKVPLIADNITAGEDEEAYSGILVNLFDPCFRVQRRRLKAAGLTAEDARELGLDCRKSM